MQLLKQKQKENEMSFYPGTPKWPFKTPPQLEQIEEMTAEQRDAMDPVEKNDRIHSAAYGMAKAYKETKDANYDTCVLMVSQVLKTTGGAIGGHVGADMVGKSQEIAKSACREVFLD